MATVTLTITDSDINKGLFGLDYVVADHLVSEGRFTGAHLIGAFLNLKFATGALALEADEFAKRNDISIASAGPDDAATVVFTFTDTDIDSGQYKADIAITPTVPTYFTAALLTAHTIVEMLRSQRFLDEVWEYAEMIAAGNDGASVSNTEYRPETNAA